MIRIPNRSSSDFQHASVPGCSFHFAITNIWENFNTKQKLDLLLRKV